MFIILICGINKGIIMSNYSQIIIQIVFAVHGRESLIKSEWEERLYQYITGIIRGKKQKLLAINGIENHIHILVGIEPSCCLSDLVREIKKASNDFINSNRLSSYRFSWQDGFGAFSYSKHEMASIIHYILNQKEHHKTLRFKDEYLEMLESNEIEYDKRYLFDWVD
jgi:putative transposase